MKKIYLILILLFIILLNISITNAIIRINEVMYNPEGSDNNKEFIEIYMTNYTNLTNWIISDSSSNDTLVEAKYYSPNYALIVEDGFNLDINATIYTVGSTIGNGLNNDEDNITLYNKQGNVIDSIYYNSSMGANGNGKSLELCNNTLIESFYINGTPGRNNTCIKDNTTQDKIRITVILDKIYTKVNYTKIFKIENFYNKTINCTVRYNITRNNQTIKQDIFTVKVNRYTTSNTGNIYLDEQGNYTICGEIINNTIDSNTYKTCKNITAIDLSKIKCNITFNISTEKILYNINETIYFKFNISNNTIPFEITYWIDDLFNNTLKNKYTTTNINKKSWTPKNIDENDMAYLIKAIIDVPCINIGRNYTEKLFVVKNKETNTKNDSEMEIKEIKNKDNTIEVKARIYKGDTRKTVVYFYAKNNNKIISQKTKFYAMDKFREYNIVAPIILNECYKNIVVIVDGLGKKETKNIELECNKNKTEKKTKNKQNETFILDILHLRTIDKTKFNISVKINSNKNENISICSYIYRGNKCYSYNGNRTANKLNVVVASGRDYYVNLPIILNDNTTNGDYYIKLKIKRQDYKTEKELKKKITIKLDKKEIKNNTNTNNKITNKNNKQMDNNLESYLFKNPYLFLQKTKTRFITISTMVLIILLIIYIILNKNNETF